MKTCVIIQARVGSTRLPRKVLRQLPDGSGITVLEQVINRVKRAELVDEIVVATTINGKPLYKPNTTNAPNLIAGKAYTVWYDLATDCFFLKASPDGNAVAADVLANKTFSNDIDTGLIGSMVNNGAITNTISTQGGQYTVPSGYHNGSGKVTASFANLIAGNIKSGVNIGGVTGNLQIPKSITITGSISNSIRIDTYSDWATSLTLPLNCSFETRILEYGIDFTISPNY
jgi:hypothetical protein